MITIIDFYEKKDTPGEYQFKAYPSDEIFTANTIIHEGQTFTIVSQNTGTGIRDEIAHAVTWFSAVKVS